MLQSSPAIHVGLDVSKLAIAVALLRPNGTGIDEDRIANTPEAVRALVRRWPDRGSVRAVGGHAIR